MIAFAVIGALALTLIYFVLRYQNAQRELILMRSTAKLSAQKAHSAFVNLMALSTAQQKALIETLESANSKGLLKQEPYNNLKVLFSLYAEVILTCSEKGTTVEEALKVLLKKYDHDIANLKLIISKYPSNIRMSWSKNTPEGFIIACNEIAKQLFGTTEQTEKAEGDSVAS